MVHWKKLFNLTSEHPTNNYRDESRHREAPISPFLTPSINLNLNLNALTNNRSPPRN